MHAGRVTREGSRWGKAEQGEGGERVSYGWRWNAGRRRGGACVPGTSFERCRGCTHYELRGLARHTRDEGRVGAHSGRECAGSSRVVRRGVLGQVVHLRTQAWRLALTAVCTHALRTSMRTRPEPVPIPELELEMLRTKTSEQPCIAIVRGRASLRHLHSQHYAT